MSRTQIYIAKEKTLMDLEYTFVTEFIKLRKSLNLSQQQMANNANVIRETVARIENNIVSPQVNTLLKILEPVGYTLKIVPIENK